MELNLKGTTRIVFLFRTFVVKIPNFLYCHQHFLNGCYANWSERRLWKNFRDCYNYDDVDLLNLVIPSMWCSWFGLIQIQARATELERHLTEEECEIFKSVCGLDNKKENFGIYKNKLVCLDYP